MPGAEHSLPCCDNNPATAPIQAGNDSAYLQDLSRNQLVELPPGLSAVSSLRELVAEGNCFPRIPQVCVLLGYCLLWRR